MGENFKVELGGQTEWTKLIIERSRHFRADDPGFTLSFNYMDRRDEFLVATYAIIGSITDANTPLKTTAPAGDAIAQQFGSHKNDKEKKEWTVLVNGKVEDRGYTSASIMEI